MGDDEEGVFWSFEKHRHCLEASLRGIA